MIALKSMQSMEHQKPDHPGQQGRDQPQRHRNPAVSPRLGLADGGDRLRCEHQAVAGDGVELLDQHRAARHQAGHAGEEVGGALRGILDPAGPRWRSIHSRTTGSDTVHMSSFGLSERATPSTTTMVFCSSSSSGRVRISNIPVTSNSSIKSFAIEISSAGRLWIGSPMARIAWAKFSTEWCEGT